MSDAKKFHRASAREEDGESIVILALVCWFICAEVHRRTSDEGPEGVWRYGCTLSLTLALNKCGG